MTALAAVPTILLQDAHLIVMTSDALFLNDKDSVFCLSFQYSFLQTIVTKVFVK